MLMVCERSSPISMMGARIGSIISIAPRTRTIRTIPLWRDLAQPPRPSLCRRCRYPGQRDPHARDREDAARGTLPSVAWIDPNFSNFNPIGFQPNDDHAPADIKDGQELVLAVYHALATGPQWEKTLLIIFYDEHGGFFDHVPPPEAPDDDPGRFGHYGVRVPALIVSPWVSEARSRTPCSTTPRSSRHSFCASAPRLCGSQSATSGRRRASEPGQPRYMGTRVAHANDLGEFLARSAPRPPPDRYALIQDAAARSAARAEGTSTDHDALARQPKTDLQKRIAAANRELRRLGTPPTGRRSTHARTSNVCSVRRATGLSDAQSTPAKLQALSRRRSRPPPPHGRDNIRMTK